MNSDEILRVEHLTYRYSNMVWSYKKQKNVIKDACFLINRGFVYGVAGRNSVGKTTLLKLLGGEYARYEGSIEMNGADDMIQYKNRVGMVMEDTEFIGHISLIDNAEVLGAVYEHFDIELFKKYMDMYGVDIYQYPGDMSAGDSMKFRIAFAMSYSPEILILDEPAGVLDVAARERLMNDIRYMATEKNMTVIMATHLTGDIDRIADYVMFVYGDGSVTVEDREKLADRYMLLRGSREQIDSIPASAIVSREESDVSVTAMTDSYEEIKKITEKQGIIVQKPDIEDIMYFSDRKAHGGGMNSRGGMNSSDGTNSSGGKARHKSRKGRTHSEAERRSYMGSNYAGYIRSCDRLKVLGGTKWVQRLWGMALLAFWCHSIVTMEQRNGITGFLSDIGMVVMMFICIFMTIDTFEVMKKMEKSRLYKIYRCRPVSGRDMLRRLVMGKIKGLLACIAIMLAIECMEGSIPPGDFTEVYVVLIAYSVIDVAIDWRILNEKADYREVGEKK